MWTVTIPSHLAVFVGLVVSIRRARQIGGQSDTHGSARWATRADLEDAGLLGRDAGVYVGAWSDGDTTHYLRHDGPQHVLAFAPARSGKGVGLVLPTLLSWPASVVVHDIKGENWALTAGWRRQRTRQRLPQVRPDGRRRLQRPLQPALRGPTLARRRQGRAEHRRLLIDPAGAGGHDHWDLHWNLTAHDLLVGVILHVLYAERDKTSAGVSPSSPTPPVRSRTRSARCSRPSTTPAPVGWTDPSTGQPTRTHPVVAGAARALLNKSDNERSSVVSSAVKFLNLYRDPIVAANTETCDFALRDLLGTDRPVSLYLTMPPSDIIRTRSLLRLLLNQLGRRLTETLDAGGMSGSPRPPRLLLMLDEFPALGRLDFLQTALAYLPGYGITAYLIVQDLAQLAQTYGRDESIVSNCHVRVAYAANKVETAKVISEMAGAMTVHRGDPHLHREPAESRADARDGVRAGVSAPAPDPGRGHAPARRRGPDLRGGPAAHLRPADPVLRGSRLRGPGGDSAPLESDRLPHEWEAWHPTDRTNEAVVTNHAGATRPDGTPSEITVAESSAAQPDSAWPDLYPPTEPVLEPAHGGSDACPEP